MLLSSSGQHWNALREKRPLWMKAHFDVIFQLQMSFSGSLSPHPAALWGSGTTTHALGPLFLKGSVRGVNEMLPFCRTNDEFALHCRVIWHMWPIHTREGGLTLTLARGVKVVSPLCCLSSNYLLPASVFLWRPLNKHQAVQGGHRPGLLLTPHCLSAYFGLLSCEMEFDQPAVLLIFVISGSVWTNM